MRAWLVLCCGLVAAAPCAAQGDGDRWQLTLDSGVILWELHLVRLSGDTLVLRQADTTRSVPLRQISELRLVQKSVKRLGAGGGGVIGVLSGADDKVYQLTLLDLGEKRQLVRRILQDHPPQDAPSP